MVCSAKRVSLGEPSTTGYQAFSRLGTSKPPICWGGFNTSQPDFFVASSDNRDPSMVEKHLEHIFEAPNESCIYVYN
jgi:hypothetical protein